MSPALVVSLGAAMVVVALAAGRLVTRLAPTWSTPSRSPRWAASGLVVALVALTLDALGTRWLERASGPLDLAAAGASGAVAAFGLMLGLSLVTALGLMAWPSRSRGALLFGVAPDGSALEGVRRPLRWGVLASLVAGLAALMVLERGEVVWAAAMNALTGLALAFAPAAEPAVALAPVVSPPAAAPDPSAMRDAFHRALGAPPIFEREPAVAPNEAFIEAIVAADQPLLAIVAPEGAGKLRAARRLAGRDAERGGVTLWLSDDDLGRGTMSIAALVDGLQRGASFPRLGRVVVDARVASSGEALATLRYALHRLIACAAAPPKVMVLGGPSAVVIARAIGAAEPRVVRPSSPLPTRAIARYLLEGPPDAELAAKTPDGVYLVALDRPRALARRPGAGDVAREYLVPTGGPRGRRLREDRGRGLVGAREPRLLVALPGDRHAPEGQQRLARFHLRAALAEAPQEPERLAEVFSSPLVTAELAALERAGLLDVRLGWDPGPAGLVPRRRLAARLGPDDLERPETIALVEPRSARRLEVSRARFDFDHFDGAIVTLSGAAAAERFEVRRDGDHAVLVPTALAHATPVRTLTLHPTSPPRRTRVRFRGARELEVHEVALTIDAVHRGVRQFAAGTTEARAVTRLLSEPLALAPLATHGRLLFFDEPDASLSAPALHALTHALREVLPCLFDNADDLGVTWTVSPRPAIALFDAHPDGLGAAADLGDDDLEALLGAAAELLRCTCAASCAACCESTSCTDESVPLDRHGASRALEALLVPRPIRIPSSIQAADPAAARLRRTG